ncbi:unnamed protein product [Withania somnifera]
MAKNLNDCEFWLPSQFLTDDELLMDFKSNSIGPVFGTHSDLSSPVESVIGSVDTESDEEECITGLTRKMAHSTFHENSYDTPKDWSLSSSPQSTLCGCKQGSSHGDFDQFYAAAGEVARIRMMEDGLYQTKTGLWAMPSKASTVPVSQKYSYHQLQVAQFERLKQQQIMKQSQGVLGLGKGGFEQHLLKQNQQQLAQIRGQSGVARPMNSSISCWPSLQQPQQQLPGSGMRAVFLGSPGPKRECAGTGVFLPRRIGTQTETRKKPGCSTVLLPDRVVQALNLNLEAMDVRQQDQVQARCYQGGSGSTPSSDWIYPNNMPMAQQRRNLFMGNTYPQPATISQELLLPQDWTY